MDDVLKTYSAYKKALSLTIDNEGDEPMSEAITAPARDNVTFPTTAGQEEMLAGDIPTDFKEIEKMDNGTLIEYRDILDHNIEALKKLLTDI